MQLAPTGTPPAPKYAGSLQTYDEINDRLIAFGGIDASSAQRNDVWVLSHASGLGGTPEWVKLQPKGSGPSGRHDVVSAYDPTANRLIIYGGCTGFCAQVSDTWVLTNANGLGGEPEWLSLPSSNNQAFGVGGYDPISNRMVVYGGIPGGPGSDSNEVKVLLDANGIGEPRWLALSPIGTPPPLRGFDQPGVYDPLSNTLIIFGGIPSGSTIITYNDVWVLSHANGLGGVPTWTQLNPTGLAPTARAHHALAYDPNSNRLIVFGGVIWPDGTTAQYINDTWALTHANGQGGTPEWISLTSGETPPISVAPTVGYAKLSNRLITTLGFSTTNTILNDVWVLTNASGNCTANQPCNYDVDATDPNAGDTLTYALDSGPPGMSIDAVTGLIQWTPVVGQIGTHDITVRVTDSGGLSATQSFQITVAPVAVPNVVGLDPGSAKALIGAAVLNVGMETSVGGAITLDFNSLPSEQGWTYYSDPGVSEPGHFSVGGDLLHQDTLGIGGTFAGYKIDNIGAVVVGPRFPLFVSVRARVLEEEGGTSDNHFGLNFGVLTDTDNFGVGLGIDHIGFEDIAGNVELPHDNTAFHDYVLEATPGTGYSVFIDGDLFRSGLRRALSGEANFRLFVGDGTRGPNVRGDFASYSFTQPQVVGQNPPAGTLVSNGSAVDLDIQEGPATQTVPNVVDQSQANAESAITAAGLTRGNVTTEASDTVPNGAVIRQRPVAGTKIQ